MTRTTHRMLRLLALLVALRISAPQPSLAGDAAPEFSAERWINTEPLTLAQLRGKVVLVEFWTFACWNCKNVEPYVKQWHSRYDDDGLVVVAVHTPEFDFEKDLSNVRDYVKKRGIDYPVAVDNDFSTWRAYGNWAWPAFYLVGKDGRIRHSRVGEGGYAKTEALIRTLLAEPAPQP